MMNIPYKPTNPIKYKGIEVGIWMGIVIAILYFLINYLYINSGSTFSTLQPIQSFFNRTLPTNSQAIVYLESIGNKSRAEIVANIYGFTWTSFIITLFALIISHAIFYKYFLKANKAAFSGIAPDAVDGPRFISTIFFGAAVVFIWQAGFSGLCFNGCVYHENQVHINDKNLYSVAIKLGLTLFFVGGALIYSGVLLGHYIEGRK